VAGPNRYFVRSPDGRGIAGYESRDTAEFVAREYGEGAHLVDTLAPVYHPMAQEVEDGELVYLSYGSWGTGRFSLDQDLIEAIKKGHLAIVHAFLAKGADADARDAGGAPTLCWAAAGGKADIVSLLIDHGAEINARDADGATAGDIAKERNILEIVELLRQTAANQE
jgi:hypothetical protein|tara:strand:+ start:3712 stop:4215 length:504 start_codon:yes stop_codon:yes gene_type:complete